MCLSVSCCKVGSYVLLLLCLGVRLHRWFICVCIWSCTTRVVTRCLALRLHYTCISLRQLFYIHVCTCLSICLHLRPLLQGFFEKIIFKIIFQKFFPLILFLFPFLVICKTLPSSVDNVLSFICLFLLFRTSSWSKLALRLFRQRTGISSSWASYAGNSKKRKRIAKQWSR